MGLADFLGNIGVGLAGQPQSRRLKTPPFLPPGAPIGPTPAAPPNVPPPPSVAQPDDQGDDESYDYTKPVGQQGQGQSAPTPSTPRYQSADDQLQETLAHPPERKKTGIWRELGGNLLMSTGGAIGKTLGSRLAYGDYPEKLQEYQANVANQTLAAKQARETAEEKRKIEQNQNQTAESVARRQDLKAGREAVDKDRDATRELNEKKEAGVLLGSGQASMYQTPPPVTADVPAPPVPGLAPTQATVPSPPKPPDVMKLGGMDLQVGKKPQEFKTIEERLLAVMDDQTLPPEQKKQKQDQLIQAHNLLHPSVPIHGIETDAQGNSTLVVADPKNPQGVQKIPLGPIGKPQAPNNFNIGEGRKDRVAGLKAYTPALESAERFNVMTKNYEDAVRSHDQQAMLSLLANHLGMTMGLQKGARLTKDIIHEAAQSRPWLQGLAAKFDSNGYLSGVTLTPEQMKQMISLGRERFAEDIVKGRSEAKYMGIEDDGPERPPSKAAMNFYLAQTNGDVTRAKQLAATDGWSVK